MLRKKTNKPAPKNESYYPYNPRHDIQERGNEETMAYNQNRQ